MNNWMERLKTFGAGQTPAWIQLGVAVVCAVLLVVLLIWIFMGGRPESIELAGVQTEILVVIKDQTDALRSLSESVLALSNRISTLETDVLETQGDIKELLSKPIQIRIPPTASTSWIRALENCRFLASLAALPKPPAKSGRTVQYYRRTFAIHLHAAVGPNQAIACPFPKLYQGPVEIPVGSFLIRRFESGGEIRVALTKEG